MSLKLSVLNNVTMTVQLHYYMTKTISYVNDKFRCKKKKKSIQTVKRIKL